MIKKIINAKLPLVVYNPTKAFDLNYFRECYQAGALPVLDTEFYTDQDIIDILTTLSGSDLLFGIRVFTDNQGIIDYIQQNYMANLDLIIFCYKNAADLNDFTFENRDYRFFVEAVDIELNDSLKSLDPQGIIVKGLEAPGKVSRYTSFVLMQWYLENSTYPVFVHGGVGWYTAAGMFAAGVNGVVLDDQLYLADEAPIADSFKSVIAGIKENDSAAVGHTVGTQYRFFAKLGTQIVKKLKEKELFLAEEKNAAELLYDEIKSKIVSLNEPCDAPIQSLFYLGQDAVFAQQFARDSSRIRDIIPAFFKNIANMLGAVDVHDPLRADSPLAREHGTTYPVVQGPMANVSDNADFAARVSENGGLPFLALGSLPGSLAENILKEGSEKLSRFGAGMIGIETFNKTIKTHFDLVKKYKVPFALFAGGIPAQAKELEAAGTRTYLHTPSMMMLENAIENGCTRFIFEGTEAGGHVGTLTSLALWEMAIQRFMRQTDEELSRESIMFAGGISTRTASYFISGISSGLAARGAKIGIQVGTAYLFTREIVETGAIKKLYQDVICKVDDTIVIGNTVGLASRTVKTPFSEMMVADEHRRIKEGMPLSERKTAFEKENIGSLLIGAKACCPDFGKIKEDGTCEMIEFDDESHYDKGNFLVGDSLAFERCPITIQTVHDRFFNSKHGLVANLNFLEIFSSRNHSINDDIAVVGMGCIYPDAQDPDGLWQNIVSKKYSIKEMPVDRFDPELYYSADKKAEDKSYTKIAGVIDDFTFNGEKFGYTPEKSSKLSRSQQMILESAYQAVADAGCLDEDNRIKKALRARTAVIIGTCLGNELGNDLHLKYYYPEIRANLDQIDAFKALDEAQQNKLLDDLRLGLAEGRPGYEPVHGATLNIEASRIAFHMGIEGVNYVVDAACATSFAALDCAIKELLSGDYDMALAGGVNTHLAPEPFVGFCKMGALSAEGSYPFDQRANGFVLGEGAGVVVLKRVKDAIRDNDKIYGIIKAMGSSSDGKGKAIAAPNSEGQAHALRRCFENVSTTISYDDIDFIEAHGTSTIMGDQAELETIKAVYDVTTPVGISSIKSQIGHLLGGSGVAGLIKTLKAIQNRTLPPNGQFETLADRHDIDKTPFYIITEAREWARTDGKPRRAAVSSFGFGGINYHTLIEEYMETYQPLPRSIFPDPTYDANEDRIVIAGMGVVLPGAANTDEFWQKLVAGKPVISDQIPDSRFHNEYYAQEDQQNGYYIPRVKGGIVQDYRFNNVKYRIPPFAAKSIDRAQLFALDAATQAIEQANLQPLLSGGNRTAVILGTISGEMSVENVLRVRADYIEKLLNGIDGVDEAARKTIADQLGELLRARYMKNTEDTIPGLLSNIVSGRIANFFNCNGANFVVDASCASATVAMDLAIKGLKSKDYDFVVTGGADANLYPTVMLAFKRLSLLSDDQCKLFDKGAKGYVMGEGAAVHVMTTYKNAVKNKMPILAELNNIKFKSSVPRHLLSPSEKAYSDAINCCYDTASITKKQISHLDVFGCCNSFLDLIEKQALEASFSNDVYFGNVKPEFGYFKAANPAVVLTKLVLMNQHKKLLPNNSYSPETTLVGKDSVLKPNDRLIDVSDRHMLCFAANVNGIGGDHGHTLVNSLPEWMLKSQPGTDPSLKVIPEKTADRSPVSPAPAARPAPSASTPVQKKASPAALTQQAPMRFSTAENDKVCALLCGQGSQYTGMMREMYDSNEMIRNLLDKGNRIFLEERGYSLLDIIFGDDSAPLNLTENTQPAIFMATAAVFNYLKLRGFDPDYFIGHSIGEYSALYCSGMLDFEPAMRLIIKRADLMKRSTDQYPGRIMVAFCNAADTAALIAESGIEKIYIANKNSEKQTAVAGEEAGIDAFCAYLKTRKIMVKKLALSAAFHTPMLKDASDQLRRYMEGLTFNTVDFSRIISNVTARPYPNDPAAIKDLLARQIQSPLEFIASVQYVYGQGAADFVEIGTGRILTNLLKNISIGKYACQPAMDPKKGQQASLDLLIAHLESLSRVSPEPVIPILEEQAIRKAARPMDSEESPEAALLSPYEGESEDFEDFIKENESSLKKLMYQEYLKHRREKAVEAVEKFDFCTDRIAISGVSVGLPGTGNKVFNSDNFDKLLAGNNFIEPLTDLEKQKILDMNITRVYKDPNGNARFYEIKTTEDVIQLAGKLGYFNLEDEYGIEYDYDITISLAIAAGIEALKDAKIPLVMQYKTTSTGKKIPAGFCLPQEMQENTGVILTSLFPGFDTLITHITKYFYNKFYVRPYDELENIYYHLMAVVTDTEIKSQLTDWFFRIKERRKEYGSFNFDRNILFDVVPLGSAHFAQLIKAKGPNIHMSGACASTTQAVGLAEDWIRTGRCDRVIVIGGEASTSEAQNPWIGSGFLAMGAATVKNIVAEAAKPFDVERNGTILGSGAVSLIVEREDKIKDRGFNGQAEVLGTHLGNSAYHATQIDVQHMTEEMQRFIARAEKRHGIRRSEFAGSMLFMSHETFTPARGGSASAEVSALKNTFPEDYKKIIISNTKGFTGHTLGAALEDAVMVKALQKGIAPPIANLTNIPEEFNDLNLNQGLKQGTFRYALHLAAGFGSHFSFLFLRKIDENEVRGNKKYHEWLKKVSGSDKPTLAVIKNALCIEVESGKAKMAPPAVEPAAVESSETAVAAPAASVQPTPVAAPETKGVDASISQTIQTIIADQTGYTVDMLEADLDLEADLGIDTVKQVEIFGKISDHFGLKVPEDLKLVELNTIAKLVDYIQSQVGGSAAPVAASSVVETAAATAADSADMLKTVQTIIADQTGYTVDMLEADLDLEADLGIDTVKQVEIFGKISDHFGLKVPEDLKLVELNTIAKLVEYIQGMVPAGTAVEVAGHTAVVSETVAPAAEKPAGSADILTAVQQIIADQTGYTVDMLEADLDLEADLGIDTVKQVEIFGKISDHFGLKVPEDLKLVELNTITRLVEYIEGNVTPSGDDTPPEGGPGKGEPETAAAESGPADAGHLAAVQQIIADQTGYTVDMLEADLDLEADLGIDTVKQVEIFGKISDHFGLKVPEDLKLVELNTIARLVEYIQAQVSGAAAAEPAAAVQPAAPAGSAVPEDSPIKRLVVGVKKAELPAARRNIFENRTVLVSLDRFGFAEKVIEQIQQQSGTVVTMGTDTPADFTYVEFEAAASKDSDVNIKKVIKKVAKKHPEISGFIHLAPLNYCLADEPIDEKQINGAIKAFFIVVKRLFPMLNQAGGLVSTLSFDSIIFPYLQEGGRIHPTFAGIAGMMKTVNKEMPDTLVKAVDFSEPDPAGHVQAIVDRYLAELMSGDRRVEVGYKGDKRFVLTLDQQDTPEQGDSIIQSGDTVLVTGGARGITYEILKKLVQAHRIDLVILGRSDISKIDPAFLSDQVDAQFILNQLKVSMKGAKPLEIKKAVDRVIKLKETIDNIEYLKSLGVQVNYHSVDVTDAEAVKNAVDQHPTINGVIHAAGLEESQFIEKKKLSSFNRVFDTKIYGIMNLLEALKTRDYGFFLTFSSVTARFGNEGQIDYTGANDMLIKFLMREKADHPQRNYKVYDWTAWEGAGMATNPTVKKVLEQRGLKFLPLEQGVGFFINELTDKTQTEVVVTGLDYDFDIDNLMSRSPSGVQGGDAPFLDTPIEKTAEKVVYSRVLDLKRDLFLLDHAKDEIPIFLGATGIETMAEAAVQLAGPDLKLVELTDFSIPYGIKILKQRPKEIVVSAEIGDRDRNLYNCRITSQFKNPKGVAVGDPKLHYQGVYRFAEEALEDTRITLPEFKPVAYEGDFKDLIYHPARLFMNGLFDSIHDFVSFDGETMITRVMDISHADFFAGQPSPDFETDVILLDAMFQTGGLYEFISDNMMVLPYKIKTMKFYRPTVKHQEYLCLTRKTATGDETNTYQLDLVDSEGNLHINVEDFQMVKFKTLEKEYQILDRIKS